MHELVAEGTAKLMAREADKKAKEELLRKIEESTCTKSKRRRRGLMIF
jgi:hypothetical protein